MASQLYNNTFDTLATAIDSVVTSFDVSSGDIPTVSAGDYIPIHVVRASDNAFEIMHVTAVSGTTLTVDRAAESPGDSPLTFSSGDRVEIRPTRQSLGESDVSGNEVTSSSGTQLVSAALDDRARLSGGADANFTLMPQVGGDPLIKDQDAAKLSGGSNANFVLMPQVGGDSVVESGSNSDGEWTRWADGTQITKTVGVGSGSGFVSKTLPAEYVSADYVVTGSANVSSSSDSGVNVSDRTTTAATIAVVTNGGFSSGSSTIWATQGRWK